MRYRSLTRTLIVSALLGIVAGRFDALAAPDAKIPLGELMSVSSRLLSEGDSARRRFFSKAKCEDADKLRREFTTAGLKALKVLIDNGVPEPTESARPKMPGPMTLYDPLGCTPAQLQVEQRRLAAEMEAHTQALLLDDLWCWRGMLTESIVDGYSRQPYATEELRRLATEILANPVAVKSLMSAVDAKIASRTQAGIRADRPTAPGSPAVQPQPTTAQPPASK